MATKETNQVNASVCDETDTAVEQLRRARGLEYRSDAARLALERGLSDLGYLGPGMTPARRLVRDVAKVLFTASMTLFALSAFTTVVYGTLAMGMLAGSAIAVAVDKLVLVRVEPSISNQLPEVKKRGSP